MKWDKYTIETTTQAEDLVCGMLQELGVQSIEIEDKQPITEEEKKAMYIDILPELPEDDGVAYISFYVDPELEQDENISGQDVEQLLTAIREELEDMRGYCDVGTGRILTGETEDKDWINTWKEFFKPFAVDDILIKPTWEQAEDADRYPVVIDIDPGTAFGTGMHETTQLCLRALRKYVNGDTRVFDVGCGSGILSILALKLGAKHVTMMDIDPDAVASAKENMEVNRLEPDRYTAFCGNLLEGRGAAELAGGDYDIAVANILADVILPMTPLVKPHLKRGGLFITSGILDTKEEQVRRAKEESGFAVVEVLRQNDWCSVIGKAL